MTMVTANLDVINERVKLSIRYSTFPVIVNQALTASCLILHGKREDSVRNKRARVKLIVHKNTPERAYKKYESHPYWKRIDKAITDLVENQDLVERRGQNR